MTPRIPIPKFAATSTAPAPLPFKPGSTAPVQFERNVRMENIKLNYRSPKKLTTDDLFRVADIVESKISNRSKESNTMDVISSRRLRSGSSKRRKLGHVKGLGSGTTLNSTGRAVTTSRRKRPISAPNKRRNL